MLEFLPRSQTDWSITPEMTVLLGEPSITSDYSSILSQGHRQERGGGGCFGRNPFSFLIGFQVGMNEYTASLFAYCSTSVSWNEKKSIITERRRSLLEVPCAFIYQSVYATGWDWHGRDVNEGPIFSHKEVLESGGLLDAKFQRNMSSRSAFPTDLSPHTIKNVYSHRVLKEETLLCFWSANKAFPDCTGTGKLSHWTPIFKLSTNRK